MRTSCFAARRSSLAAAAAILFSLSLCSGAWAALTPTLESVVSTPDGFLWTYRVSLGSITDMRDDGAVPFAGINPEDEVNLIRDYLTIHDFHGLAVTNPAVVQFSLAGFDYRVYAFGSTPSDVIVTEDATPNVTVFRSAGDLIGPQEFSVALLSSLGFSESGDYASEVTHRQLGVGESAVGTVLVPSLIPEPSGIALAALILSGAALVRRPRG
jgi:hypothetical protein